MKLFASPTSPFVRKILVQLHESGLQDRVEQVPVSGLSPTDPVAELSAQNPLGKIPALVVDEATTLYDSRVIAEYLESISEGPPLLAPSGPERFTALRRVALADGVCDAAVLGRYETVLRPVELRWEDWLEAQFTKIRRGCAALGHAELPDSADLGTIAVAVALAYLDLRWPDHDLWRTANPALAEWHARFSERASMRATTPPTDR